jgi:DNA-binding NarL/FixJ family response regulator
MNTENDNILHRYEQPPLIEEPSERELAILQLLANGLKTVQVAKEFSLVPYTIKREVIRANNKLHAKNRTHAVAIAIRRGLIQ